MSDSKCNYSVNTEGYSFEQWVQFVFNHPIGNPSWYWEKDWQARIVPREAIEFMIRLFLSPEFLFNTYSIEQVKNGFEFIISPQGVAQFIFDREAPLSLRVRAICSMAALFSRLFARQPLQPICHMWWEAISCPAGSVIQPSVIQEDLVKAWFETLCDVLALDSRDCQMSALRGLSCAFVHPDSESDPWPLRAIETIETFVLNRCEGDPELRSNAIAAREGRLA